MTRRTRNQLFKVCSELKRQEKCMGERQKRQKRQKGQKSEEIGNKEWKRKKRQRPDASCCKSTHNIIFVQIDQLCDLNICYSKK
jgi:hypothetical protein